MAYSNNNNNNQRDLLEDFLNDIGPVQTGPSSSGITSFSSANMGGLSLNNNYNNNNSRQAPPPSQYPPAVANPFAPASSAPLAGYNPQKATTAPDPFDDDAFNFRSSPYSPPNPTTNPFYLKNSPSPQSQPQQPQQPLPLAQSQPIQPQQIHIPMAATNGHSTSTKQQDKSNKYGSTYGSRPGQTQASASFSSTSASSSSFFPASSSPSVQQQQQPQVGMSNSAPNVSRSGPSQYNQSSPNQFNAAPPSPQGSYNPYGPPPPQQQSHPPSPQGSYNPYGPPPPQQSPQSLPPQRNPYGGASFDDPFSTPSSPTTAVPSNWTPNGVAPPLPVSQSGVYPPPTTNMQGSNVLNPPVAHPANALPSQSSAKAGPPGSSFLSSVKGLFSAAPEPALQRKKPKGRLQQMVTFAQFQIAANQIQALFSAWVQNRWFAPVGFMQKIQVGQPQRELVPFWIFSTTTMTTTHGKCCYISYEKGEGGATKTVENWQDGKATHTGSFKDILLPAWDFDDERKDLLEELKGWDAGQAKQTCNATQIPPNITPHPSVEWTDVWPQYTENVIKKHETAEGKNQLVMQSKSTRVRELKSIVTYTSLSKKLVFFPVYSFLYTYEGKSYKVYVQGQNGQLSGERPYGFGALGESAKSGIESISDFFHDKMKDMKK